MLGSETASSQHKTGSSNLKMFHRGQWLSKPEFDVSHIVMFQWSLKCDYRDWIVTTVSESWLNYLMHLCDDCHMTEITLTFPWRHWIMTDLSLTFYAVSTSWLPHVWNVTAKFSIFLIMRSGHVVISRCRRRHYEGRLCSRIKVGAPRCTCF